MITVLYYKYYKSVKQTPLRYAIFTGIVLFAVTRILPLLGFPLLKGATKGGQRKKQGEPFARPVVPSLIIQTCRRT